MEGERIIVSAVKKSDDITRLVNRQYPITEEELPSDLVTLYSTHLDASCQLRKVAYDAFCKLQQAATNEGYEIDTNDNNDGFRTFAMQQEVMDYYTDLEGIEKASLRVAPVGTSEHHTGLAIDVSYYQDGIGMNEKEMECSNVHDWLLEHAYEYGFILRYPKGKEAITGIRYEPWHYRYVGIELATILKNRNIVMEEYQLKSE